MSTILKALRRLEEDDARSRGASKSGEERLVSDSSEPRTGLPDSAYAAADSLANAASPRAEIPAEAQQEGVTLDRALSLARSRAVLAVATAVGLLALTFGAISLRDSGGIQLSSDPKQDAASSAAVHSFPSASSPSSPSPASLRATSHSAPAMAAQPPRPSAPTIAAAIPAAAASPPTVAVAPAAANALPGSNTSPASTRATPEASQATAPTPASTLAASVQSKPANAEITPMRSRPTKPQIAKSPRSAPKPALETAVPVVAAAVSPTRAAAAGTAAAAEAKIAEARRSLADRPVSRRPRAERLATPAPVSSADTDESIPLAEMLPMTSATPATSVTPTRTTRATIPEAPTTQFESKAPTTRPAERLSPLAQARAMESAAAAASSSSGRPSPNDSAAATAVVVAPARAAVGAMEPAAQPRDRDVERVDRRGLPDVRVLRTSWHPQPDRRSAKVSVDASSEVLTLREGDAVGGLVVQTISPSSVLFESGGIEIRRRVGAGR